MWMGPKLSVDWHRDLVEEQITSTGTVLPHGSCLHGMSRRAMMLLVTYSRDNARRDRRPNITLVTITWINRDAQKIVSYWDALAIQYWLCYSIMQRPGSGPDRPLGDWLWLGPGCLAWLVKCKCQRPRVDRWTEKEHGVPLRVYSSTSHHNRTIIPQQLTCQTGQFKLFKSK